MNRVIFGIAAGVSALTVFHWYTARKREVISSAEVDSLNGRSSVNPHVLSVDIGEESSTSGNVPTGDRENEVALLKKEMLRLEKERDEFALQTQKLSEQLLEETSQREYLEAKSSYLQVEIDIKARLFENDLDDLRAANREAMIAMHDDFSKQNVALQLDNARLRCQNDSVSNDLINVRAERAQALLENATLAEEVGDVQSKLQAALINVQDLKKAADSSEKELLQIRAELVTSAARIAELESVNLCQSNKLAQLEMIVQEQSRSTLVTSESEEPDAALENETLPVLHARDEQTEVVDESAKPSSQDDAQDVATPPLVQEAAPRREKVAREPQVPVFPCMDIRFRNQDIQGYTIVMDSSGELQDTISPNQQLAEELKPVASPPAKQEAPSNVTSCAFKVINAVVEHELSGSYQLLNIASQYYGQIIGKEGKHVKAFQKSHGVKIMVTPPRGPHGQIRVTITQGNNEGRRTVAKQIVESLPSLVEIPFASLGRLTPQRKKQLWTRYFVDIVEDESSKKCVLRGNLGNCLRLFKEQKV
ncbi:uncharacterized protein LOC132087880 [Daphnia carinata]|uniref:uncharacterized protein LOC132087880 n=1 Tax=Daphnia carinata TaxID=120202 RepID=UPI002868D172|nr:uncharacterized protein LOC132087880 [Daphnia carinata]